jgi:hypothetical protein
MDSYRLLASLQKLKELPESKLPGATGNLYLGDGNQINRRLMWARFTDQGPKPLGFAPRLEPADVTSGSARFGTGDTRASNTATTGGTHDERAP